VKTITDSNYFFGTGRSKIAILHAVCHLEMESGIIDVRLGLRS